MFGFYQPRVAVATEIIVARVPRHLLPVVEQPGSTQAGDSVSDDGYAYVDPR